MADSTPTPAGENVVAPSAVDLRGRGGVQRRVWRAFVAHPGAELTTAELARWCYPRLTGEPLRKHRWQSCERRRRWQRACGVIGLVASFSGPLVAIR